MAKQVFTKHKTWRPIKPASKGATAYHDAVINASWHIDNIKGLTKNVQHKIRNGDIVVDFGAGTGSSALLLLKDIKKKFDLLLVDNSASWLGKAHEFLHTHPRVTFVHLAKNSARYATLDETIGKEIADCVLSANTFHLVPTLKETFGGIYQALKPDGTFTFQSGNIIRSGRKKGILMIDDTVNQIHDIALQIIKTCAMFKTYRKDLDRRTKEQISQRKFVFPPHRHIDEYIKNLKIVGFGNIKVSHKLIKVNYTDWLNFLRVRRLQAGIVPEIGGREPTSQEEYDRNELITMAGLELFKELERKNPFADQTSFTTEWMYVTAEKSRSHTM